MCGAKIGSTGSKPIEQSSPVDNQAKSTRNNGVQQKTTTEPRASQVENTEKAIDTNIPKPKTGTTKSPLSRMKFLKEIETQREKASARLNKTENPATKRDEVVGQAKELGKKGDEKVDDFFTSETLLNEAAYAKTDAVKKLVLFEVKFNPKDDNNGLEVSFPNGNKGDLPDTLKNVFFPKDGIIRLPFNLNDTDPNASMSPINLTLEVVEDGMFTLNSVSSASRSNFVDLSQLNGESGSPKKYVKENVPKRNNGINVKEWREYKFTMSERAREAFPNLGESSSKLFSIKTGVKFVGSTDESNAGKSLLENNAKLAMIRSDAIRRNNPNSDESCSIQLELLTVTLPLNTKKEEDENVNLRDGFQVRDMSCFNPKFKYVGAQSLPHGGVSDDKKEEVVNQFTNLTGRAKAQLFLKYGLIHTSSNAQNMVIGLDEGKNIKHFVFRDIGDTCWHDKHIDNIDKDGAKGLKDSVKNEQGQPGEHTLKKSGDSSYPAPQMVRIGAKSLLTHGFGENIAPKDLQKQSNYLNNILDGFREYVNEATGLNIKYPDNLEEGFLPEEPSFDEVVKNMQYPYMQSSDITKSEEQSNYYKETMEKLLKKEPGYLLKCAAYCREKQQEIANNGKESDKLMRYNSAQEAFLCAVIEKEVVQSKNEIDTSKFPRVIKD